MPYTVCFEDVTKCFSLRHEGPLSFQSLLMNILRLRLRPPRERHYVLRDVSFAVEQGRMVGIIGVNGAGKSTALKLITRIIEPTSGKVEVTGRVSALLELGAGFHPDLTGRENIYLNGSVLGMSRNEIRHKFDDIVRFAELESSIDMPVRFYSSGMYMRLGFSVAIHAEPEILLVDEVLAVGDHAFQLKCLRKADELRRQGVTILFVSHDMDAVRELCDRAIWLDGGGVRADGGPDEVVSQYLRGFADGELAEIERGSRLRRGQRWGSHEVEITDVRFLDGQGREQAYFETGDPLQVEMHYVAHKRVENPVFGMALYAGDGTWISGSNTYSAGCDVGWVEGRGIVRYEVEALPLLEGSYLFSATAYDYSGVVHHAYDHHDKAFVIQLRRSERIRESLGFVHFECRWTHAAAHEIAGREGP